MKAQFAACFGLLLAVPVVWGSKPVASTTSPAAPGALSCRLAVGGYVLPSNSKGTPDNSIAADSQPNQHGMGGFLDVASGKYTPAADSDRAYIAAAHSWVPVMPNAIAPDGASYVVTEVTADSNHRLEHSTLYLVDVNTKAQRLLYAAAEHQMVWVVAYTGNGVYAEVASLSSSPVQFTLLVIDPSSGTAREVTGSHPKTDGLMEPWQAVSNGAAWGMLILNASTSHPATRLVGLDLQTGVITDWYDGGQAGFQILGFDATGSPILALTSPGATKLVLLNSPGRPTAIEVRGGTFLMSRGLGVRDAHGTWIASADGTIWLFAGGVLTKVATVPPQAGGTGEAYDPHAWRSIAGPCV